MTIGVGAGEFDERVISLHDDSSFLTLHLGQQSRIACTRLAGNKADDFYMRFHPRATSLTWKKGLKRPDKANAIDVLCADLVPDDGPEKEDFESRFEEVPSLFTKQERQEWLKGMTDVVVSSDAFVSLNWDDGF